MGRYQRRGDLGTEAAPGRGITRGGGAYGKSAASVALAVCAETLASVPARIHPRGGCGVALLSTGHAERDLGVHKEAPDLRKVRDEPRADKRRQRRCRPN